MRKIISVLLLSVVGWVGVEGLCLASANAAALDPKKVNINPLALTAVGVVKARPVNADRTPARAVRAIPVVAKPRLAAMGDVAALHREPARFSALGRLSAGAPERFVARMMNAHRSADFRALAIAASPKSLRGDATAREMAGTGAALGASRVLLSKLAPSERRERGYAQAAAGVLPAKAESGPANAALLSTLTLSEHRERGYAQATAGILPAKAESGPAKAAILSTLTPGERRERGYTQAATAELGSATVRVRLAQLMSTEARERANILAAASPTLSTKAALGLAANRLLLAELTSAEPRERRNISMAAIGAPLAKAKLAPAKMVRQHATHRRLYAQADYGPTARVRSKHRK